MVTTGEAQVSQCAGFDGVPSAFRTRRVTTYEPSGTNLRRLLLPLLCARVPSQAKAKNPVAVRLRFGPTSGATIVRVFRGHVRPGMLEAYVDTARTSAFADAMAAEGPLVLFVGVEHPDRFVTVSAWTSWDRIERATGGDVDRPLASLHGQLIAAGSASHFEVLATESGALDPIQLA